MSDERTNLLGMTEEELSTFSQRIGEASYRGSQLYRWLYARGATSFATMTDLGKEFRPFHAGHVHVGNDHVERPLFTQAHAEFRVFRGDYFILIFKIIVQHHADTRFVVDDQDRIH